MCRKRERNRQRRKKIVWANSSIAILYGPSGGRAVGFSATQRRSFKGRSYKAQGAASIKGWAAESAAVTVCVSHISTFCAVLHCYGREMKVKCARAIIYAVKLAEDAFPHKTLYSVGP